MPNRLRLFLLVCVGALGAAAFSTTLAYASTRLSGMYQPLDSLAVLNTAFWLGWAMLSVPLVWLAQRVRVDRRPQVAVPVHLAATVAASLIHVSLLTTAQIAVRGVLGRSEVASPQNPWIDQWVTTFPVQLAALLDWELLVGAGIIAVAHAFFFHAEARERALRQANLETRLVEARLQTLQRQLHPHFLFNTLNAISTLMRRDVDAADRTLVQLSGLLRVTLDADNRPLIRLSEEIAFLDKYVQIERTRLGDRLAVSFDIDADILDAFVPTLILQPLVENAIKYGVVPHGRPGSVSIAGHREGDLLVLSVTDDGPGPSERAMAALSTGIGLSNTRARLSHQYGARHRFEFKRVPGGFTVVVAFPFRTDVGRIDDPQVRLATEVRPRPSEEPWPRERSAH